MIQQLLRRLIFITWFIILGFAGAIIAVTISPLSNIIICSLCSILCFVMAWFEYRNASMKAKLVDLRLNIMEVSVEIAKLKEQEAQNDKDKNDDPADTGVAI